MEQGFSPNSGIKAVRNAHVPPSSPIEGARGALRTPHAVLKEDKALATAERVRQVANVPFMLMVPGMVFGLLGGAAGMLKRNRTQVVLGGTGKALLDGMRQTPLNRAFETPATMVGMVAEKSAEVGGRAEKWAAPLVARSEKMSGAVQGIQVSIGRFVEKMPAPVTSALQRIGKLPVGAGVAAAAATAGIVAISLKRKKTTRDQADTVQEMRGVFGANHPLVAEAGKLYTKDQSRSIFAAAAESANELMFVGFEAMPNASFIMMMAGQMGVSSAQKLFVTENPTADAFKGLQMAQQGVPVPAGQQAYYFQTLLGALPAAQAKGGVRNHLVAAAGKELATKGTTLTQFAELIGNESKLNGFLTEVSGKMEAAKAAKPAAPTARTAAAHPVMHQAAPAAKINNIRHDGAVTATQRHL